MKITAPVQYGPHLAKGASERIFEALSTQLEWERREGAPRSEYWTSKHGQPYTYGQGAGIRTYESRKSHHYIDALRNAIEMYHGCYLAGCFLNYYLDGTDSLGWHADDDPGIDHTKPIVVVTVGHGRTIEFKKQEKGSHPEHLFLESGSVLLMLPGMQQTHYHRIPKIHGGAIVGPRISLTFRGLVRG